MCAEYCPFIPHMSLSTPFYFLLKRFFPTSPLLFIYLFIYCPLGLIIFACVQEYEWRNVCWQLINGYTTKENDTPVETSGQTGRYCSI